jgi:hypothetical protein
MHGRREGGHAIGARSIRAIGQKATRVSKLGHWLNCDNYHRDHTAVGGFAPETHFNCLNGQYSSAIGPSQPNGTNRAIRSPMTLSVRVPATLLEKCFRFELIIDERG